MTADAVRSLTATVEHYGVKAGVLVCFNRFMRTVENQRSKATFEDYYGVYPVIQGYSVEDLLDRKPLALPPYGLGRQGGAVTAASGLLEC